MRVRFLTWFLFVSCTQALSNSSLHTNLSSEQRGLNSSINNAQTQQPFENYGSIKETMRLDKKDEEKQGLLHASIKNAHAGGRGAGGGTNDNRHQRHPANSAPPLLSWSSTMCVCLTLVLMFFFHVELL